MSVAKNLSALKKDLPAGVDLVAVSKTKPNEAIEEAYGAGQRIFGENKIQELSLKAEALPKDIQWHMIGHLQSNKVKYIAPFVSLIHGVDSLKLLKEIDKQGLKNKRIIPCLLQFHIASEESKFGFNLQEALEILESESFGELRNVEIQGVMGMATFTKDENQIHREFKSLKDIFSRLRKGFFEKQTSFKEISMGMSGDYSIAIEEGSTMVRVGSAIFGARNYPA